MKREFKGIWIPAEIWLHKDLSKTEVCMLSEIDSLDHGKGCFAANKYLGDFLGISESRAKMIISSLRGRGFILDLTNPNGKMRLIRSIFHRIENDQAHDRKQSGAGSKTITIDNQLDKQIDIKENSKENILFTEFWNLYNYKVGKPNALRAFSKLNKADAQRATARVPEYLASIEEKRFQAHPATWLNRRGWEDEIIPVKRKQPSGNINGQVW